MPIYRVFLTSVLSLASIAYGIPIIVAIFFTKLYAYFPGDVLDDYPDSPVGDSCLSGEAASHLLDSEDAMETGSNAVGSGRASGAGSVLIPGSTSSGGTKRTLGSVQRHPCQNDGKGFKSGPSLPPIYYSVLRKKLAKMAVRHLDGGACKEDDSTNFGASVYAQKQIGSFSNPGDKRHNHTVHRHDHQAVRNISTSFDPVSFTCKTCPGAHQVLRRTVEGSDVGLDNPGVFVLTDQNFPPMVPAGGGGGVSQNYSGRELVTGRPRGRAPGNVQGFRYACGRCCVAGQSKPCRNNWYG
jgi:hypothetical protein